MRNMSVDCDCAGNKVSSVVIPNAGILPSRDICALGQACVDLVFEEHNEIFVKYMTSRHGFRQLTYIKELGIGNDKYKLITIDNEDK